MAERFIRSRGATPTFKGYRGFPGSICASPNAMIVHGIPGPYRLPSGDIISIDVGVTLDGWVADAARTFAVGEVDARRQQPAERHRGVAARGRRAVPCPATAWATSPTRSSASSRAPGSSVVRSLVGHGVGRNMHEDPQVPNYGKPGKGPLLEEGMVLAIEPMTTAGRPGVRVAGDGWAIYSQDGSLAAHFEFTVADHRRGPADPHPVAPPGRTSASPSAAEHGAASDAARATERDRVGASEVATMRSPA